MITHPLTEIPRHVHHTKPYQAEASLQEGLQKSAGELARATTYTGQLGKTALELLKARTEVETKSYEWGEMVTGIGGLIAKEGKEFWGFYVNDEMAQVGAADYQTEDDDVINWRFEQIDPNFGQDS